jgi:hypothetical protein
MEKEGLVKKCYANHKAKCYILRELSTSSVENSNPLVVASQFYYFIFLKVLPFPIGLGWLVKQGMLLFP